MARLLVHDEVPLPIYAPELWTSGFGRVESAGVRLEVEVRKCELEVVTHVRRTVMVITIGPGSIASQG